MGKEQTFGLDLEDEVVRRSIVLQNGNLLWPAPAAPAPETTTPGVAAPPVDLAKEEIKAITPWKKVSREVAAVTAGMGSLVVLGKLTAPAFMGTFSTFGLASLGAYHP